jgi:hypothetical protein
MSFLAGLALDMHCSATQQEQVRQFAAGQRYTLHCLVGCCTTGGAPECLICCRMYCLYCLYCLTLDAHSQPDCQVDGVLQSS